MKIYIIKDSTFEKEIEYTSQKDISNFDFDNKKEIRECNVSEIELIQIQELEKITNKSYEMSNDLYERKSNFEFLDKNLDPEFAKEYQKIKTFYKISEEMHDYFNTKKNNLYKKTFDTGIKITPEHQEKIIKEKKKIQNKNYRL